MNVKQPATSGFKALIAGLVRRPGLLFNLHYFDDYSFAHVAVANGLSIIPENADLKR